MMYKVDAMFDSFSKAATALRVSVLFLALLCAQGFPSAAPAWAEPESGLTLDFKDADIHALIKYISEATGRNFITDPTVKGKVTVYSPVKISPDEAFETFVSILRVQGYAVQKSGTAYKIVPLKEGLGQGEDAAVGRKMGSELETVVTQIVPLKVGVAAELAKILPSLLGKDYAISAYTPSNTLALTAPAPNVAKAMAFLEQVEASDTAGTSATLGLQYGDSKTLAATLAKILKSRDEEYAKKGRPTVSLVLADERTNSLLIYGDPEAIGMARDAVGSLDIPTPKGKGDVHLISLSNAKAEDLAQVINTLESLQEKLGLSYLFVSHDLSMVRHISHNVGVMYLGCMVERAPVHELYSNMLHPYTQALMSAVPIPDPDIAAASSRIHLSGDVPTPIDPPSGCRFRARCPYATEQCAQERPELREVAPDHFVACHRIK